MPVASRNDPKRPDPDALLALSRGETNGRLRVFLGAAPGVGKTFAMLNGARRLKADGLDVVVGLVETHGRVETQALIEGLEILPRRKVEYLGRALEEFDIDAALARRPKLIIVDELAHTNAPESRHPKRWQDVEELLDAGVHVWTALNIQHLESLADIVSRITGVAVRETVPDKLLREAAEVVLVDVTPDELMERLREGKVYLPETAKRAANNFFTPGNLTALRELALRRTADRVDDQMTDYLKQRAIEGPWGASERLLACIGPDEVSERVARRAAQLATALNASWIGLTIERTSGMGDPAEAPKLAELFGLVERLGGEPMRVQGHDLVEAILGVARRENVTQIVIAESGTGYFGRMLGRSLPDALRRRAGGVEIHVVASDGPTRERPSLSRLFQTRGLGLEASAAIGSVAVAVGVGEALSSVLQLPNLSMIFLTAVLFCAVRLGPRAAVLASLLSFLSYNFFFIPPIYTFTIAEPYELFALLIFLAVAVFTGSLAGRLRDQREAAMRSARDTQSLYDYSRKLTGASSADDVLWAAAAHLHATLSKRVVLMMVEGETLELKAAWPPDEKPDSTEETAARWALTHNEPAGYGTGTLPRIAFQFRPLLVARGAIAVCGFEPRRPDQPIGPEDERILTSVLDQTAIALDRAQLAREALKTATLEANEKVRDVLLDSLSHDLRTPLASIAGAATALLDLGDKMDEAERRQMLQSIDEETQRLSRFVANMIDMSRIEAGGLKVARDWLDVADVVQGAVERARRSFPAQAVRVSLAADLPLVRGDARLIEQVLFNLIDNAHKYAGEAPAVLHARRDGKDVVISVTDEGPGIKPADLERVFEKFYRGGRADGRKPGAGLGLSICRRLVEAMGGTIIAQSPAIKRRGARFIVRLPAAEPQRLAAPI